MDSLIPLYLDETASDRRICLLYEDKGIIAFEYLLSLGIARIALVYIKPEFQNTGIMEQFMEAYEFWGKKVGAKWYNLGVSTGADLTKLGYEQYEVMYIKEVK